MIDTPQSTMYSSKKLKVGVVKMLVLSRKEGESIIIDSYIEIKILDIEEGKVKLGIEAPKDIDIFRKELYLSIQEENIKAAKTKVDLEKMKKLFKQEK